MTRFLSSLGLVVYIVLAALALLWWAPNFFAANQHALPQLNYRYVAASGLPLALLLISVAARQSLLPRFSVVLILQTVLSGLSLALGLLSFQYLPQSVFFCAVHIGLTVVFLLWNLLAYRRELAIWHKRQAALHA